MYSTASYIERFLNLFNSKSIFWFFKILERFSSAFKIKKSSLQKSITFKSINNERIFIFELLELLHVNLKSSIIKLTSLLEEIFRVSDDITSISFSIKYLLIINPSFFFLTSMQISLRENPLEITFFIISRVFKL